MKHQRSIVTFAAIAVPGVLVAMTSFLTPLTPGTLDRSPEQVRMPTADTRVVCPGPLLTAGEAEGTDAEFVDDSKVSTRVVASVCAAVTSSVSVVRWVTVPSSARSSMLFSSAEAGTWTVISLHAPGTSSLG